MTGVQRERVKDGGKETVWTKMTKMGEQTLQRAKSYEQMRTAITRGIKGNRQSTFSISPDHLHV